MTGGLCASGSTLSLYFTCDWRARGARAVGVLVAGYLAVRGAAADDGGRYRNRVRALTLYWYFVGIVWICVFIAFYLL